MEHLTPDETMKDVVRQIEVDPATALETLNRLMTDYASDPRLPFLKGSVCIGLNQHDAAHRALSRAVELAPEFHIARFQLGFFELTSAEPDKARETWGPIQAALPRDHYLTLFVNGLTALIDDKFDHAVSNLQLGITANEENVPLNRDMQLIIEKCRPHLSEEDTGDTHGSAASFLLQQFKRPN